MRAFVCSTSVFVICILFLADSINVSDLLSYNETSTDNHHDSTRQLLFTDTAYYISSANEFDIFVPSIVSEYASTLATSYEICLSTRLGTRIYCAESIDRSSNRFIIPFNEVENTLKPNKLCTIYWIINANQLPADNESIINSDVYFTTLDFRPPVISHVEIKNYYGTLPSYVGEPALHIVYNCDNLAKQSADHVYFEIRGVADRKMPVVGDGLRNSVHVHGGVEPSSWFYSLTPKFNQEGAITNTSLLRSYPSFGYIEFTLNNADIQKERLYTTDWRRPDATVSLTTVGPALGEKTICIWGSNSLDGQKRIWLSQLEHLVHQFNLVYVLTDKFQSINLTDPNSIKDDTVTSLLLTLPQFAHVKVVESPYNGVSVTFDLLSSGIPNWDGDPHTFFDFMHKILLVDSHNDIYQIKVDWAREIYIKLYNFIEQQACDVIVFGNNRLSPDNRLITNVAKILNVSTVIELVNLFVDPITTPSVIVGPSKYSILHSSIQSFVASNTNVQTTVISPAVDTTNKFNVEFFQNYTKYPIYHPGCLDSVRRGHSCYNIGFMARLSNEKNPGLFVLASKILLEANPLLKFTVIGDGDLMPFLIELTERLQIRHAYVFTGWLNTNLDRHLMGIDIIVNPSIRGWSETFCIANIEAMAMKRPLVTYATGGVGEYVAEPSDLTINELYSISKNAIIVNYPTPAALSSAVALLVANESLRNSIATAGYNTVISYFTVERQMKQYQELYRRL